ncbi:MAG: hypothetical protein ACREK5_06455 [Gemmatimonadota bacterium]
MPSLSPRIVTIPAGNAAIKIDEIDSMEYGAGQEQLIFGCRFSPRGPRRLVVLSVGMGLLRRFNPSEWSFGAGDVRENATLIMIGTVGRMLEIAIRDGKNPETELAARDGGGNQYDGWSFAGGLRRNPIEDREIWRYVAAKIYWAWQYGFGLVLFDHADSLQLGLPRDLADENTGLEPGQIERVAAIGLGRFWNLQLAPPAQEVDSRRAYVPTLELITRFTDGTFPEIPE